MVKLVISPLIPLIFNREKAEGDFRYLHVRIREFASSIAFMRGEHFERISLDKSLDFIIGWQNRILLWKVSTFH
jgi:ATP-binding cassette subfamily D (ALD) protein 4